MLTAYASAKEEVAAREQNLEEEHGVINYGIIIKYTGQWRNTQIRFSFFLYLFFFV